MVPRSFVPRVQRVRARFRVMVRVTVRVRVNLKPNLNHNQSEESHSNQSKVNQRQKKTALAPTILRKEDLLTGSYVPPPRSHTKRGTWEQGNIGPGEQRYAPIFMAMHNGQRTSILS
jgi:hypothetical protein